MYVYERRPQARPEQFVDKVHSLFQFADGGWWLCDDEAALLGIARTAFENGRDSGQDMDPQFVQRLRNRKIDLTALYKEVFGVAMPLRWTRERPSPDHLLGGRAHPALDSVSELLVDSALAVAVPGYADNHRHNVALLELAGSIAAPLWEGSGYTKARSPILDILAFGRLVIEVSYETGRLELGYARKMAWKLERLREKGFVAVNVKVEDGFEVCSRKLSDALVEAGIVHDHELLRRALFSLALQRGTSDHQSIVYRSTEDGVVTRPSRPPRLLDVELQTLVQADTQQSNRALAAAVHVSQARIAQARRDAEAPRHAVTQRQQAIDLQAQGLAPADIAAKLNIPTSRVNKAIGTVKPQVDWDSEPELGLVVDSVLAERHNVTVSAVALARKKRGIPSAAKAAYVNWDEQPLGTVPDIQLAERLGVHIASVAYARQRRGIASFRSTLTGQTVTTLPEDPSA